MSTMNSTKDIFDHSTFINVNHNTHGFGIHNLPFGAFKAPKFGLNKPMLATRVGDVVIQIMPLIENGFLEVNTAVDVFKESTWNLFMSLGHKEWRHYRDRLAKSIHIEKHALKKIYQEFVQKGFDPNNIFFNLNEVELVLPIQIPNYTDFYSSKEHATNVGMMIRDKNKPLLDNWVHLPVGYHGRASSIVISGTPIHRPKGQTFDQKLEFGPCKKLDYELEMAAVIGTGNALGHPIPVEEAHEHIFGFCLLNDWSARDIQKWEYQPLGPFTSKSFATSISPWIISASALKPFIVAGVKQEPTPLPYLQTDNLQLDVDLLATLKPKNSEEVFKTCHTNSKYLYWSVSQQIAHHTITGCNLVTGDLLASGTISGPNPEMGACLMEQTLNGTKPLQLGKFERTFLEDGDEVTLSGVAIKDGLEISFGEVSGIIVN